MHVKGLPLAKQSTFKFAHVIINSNHALHGCDGHLTLKYQKKVQEIEKESHYPSTSKHKLH